MPSGQKSDREASEKSSSRKTSCSYSNKEASGKRKRAITGSSEAECEQSYENPNPMPSHSETNCEPSVRSLSAVPSCSGYSVPELSVRRPDTISKCADPYSEQLVKRKHPEPKSSKHVAETLACASTAKTHRTGPLVMSSALKPLDKKPEDLSQMDEKFKFLGHLGLVPQYLQTQTDKTDDHFQNRERK